MDLDRCRIEAGLKSFYRCSRDICVGPSHAALELESFDMAKCDQPLELFWARQRFLAVARHFRRLVCNLSYYNDTYVSLPYRLVGMSG